MRGTRRSGVGCSALSALGFGGAVRQVLRPATCRVPAAANLGVTAAISAASF